MFAMFELFRIIFSIFFLNFIGYHLPLASGECIDDAEAYSDDCKEQTTFLLSDQPSLNIEIRFDPGGNWPDFNYITAVCNVREKFPTVTFCFIPGVSETRDDSGNLQCPPDEANGGDPCMYPIVVACASQSVPDFTEFLCCFYLFPDPEDQQAGQKCIAAQNSDMVEEYEKCWHRQPSTIKPEEILLANSQNAQAAFPDAQCRHPFITFNGQYDEGCTRNAFLFDTEKVICAMLAQGVEQACGST